MSPRHTRVTQVSVRNPRADWAKPRSLEDVVTGLEHNGFVRAQTVAGLALVRVCGHVALRVTMLHGRAVLQTAVSTPGAVVKWRRGASSVDAAPWQVGREALELLAVLDVDTPVRWG